MGRYVKGEYREYMFKKGKWFSRPKGDRQNKYLRRLKHPPKRQGNDIFSWCFAHKGWWSGDRF